MTGKEWDRVERACASGSSAEPLLKDIYADAKIVATKSCRPTSSSGATHFRKEMQGVKVPRDAYVSVCGTDLVRRGGRRIRRSRGQSARPSGVSYMLANREVVRRAFPTEVPRRARAPIEHYPQALLATLKSLTTRESPRIVLLSPGIYNSAYYEHTFSRARWGSTSSRGAT